MYTYTNYKYMRRNLYNFSVVNIGKQCHGLNWIVTWDKIEGTKYEGYSQ